MIQELAELKAKTFMLQTKLKEAERRGGRISDKDDKYLTKSFQNKLAEKEMEIETMKRELTYVKDPKYLNVATGDTASNTEFSLSDSNEHDLIKLIEQLKSENQLLQGVIQQQEIGGFTETEKDRQLLEKTVMQQNAELESLTTDVESKRRKIKEQQRVIDDFKQTAVVKRGVRSNKEDAREEELNTLRKKMEEKDVELHALQMKVEGYENELQRVKSLNSVVSTEEDKFQKLYLNQITPSSSAVPVDDCSGRMTLKEVINAQNTRSGATSDSGYPSNINIQNSSFSSANQNLIDLYEPMYEVMEPATKPYELTETEMIPTEILETDARPHEAVEPSEVSHIPRLIKNASFDAPPKRLLPNTKSKIPISPTKKADMSTPLSSKEASVQKSNDENNDLAKALHDQQEDIQTLLMSVEHFEDENKKLKEELKNTTHEDENPQVTFQIIINELQDELDLYRSNIGITKQQNLLELGYERLNNIIDCNIYARNWTDIEQLQRDNEELRKENESLTQRKDVKSEESEILALTEKFSLKVDESRTLKELLETQIQNVNSQEAVIRTLKKDLTIYRAKFKNDYDNMVQELKEKKIESKNLKKQIKENGKLLQKERSDRKHDIKVLKSKLNAAHKDTSNKDEIIKKLNDQIYGLEIEKRDSEKKEEEINDQVQEEKQKSKLLKQQLVAQEEQERQNIQESKEQITKLTDQLNTTGADYEDVLMKAQSALHDAKRKLHEQDKVNDECKKQLQDLNYARKKDKEVYEEVANQMNNALAKKGDLLISIQNESQGYKETSIEEFNKLTKHIGELERQCRDYQLLLDKSETTTSELEPASRAELEESNEISEEKYHVEKENFVQNTLEPSPVNGNQTENIELEIEYEILKGCHEELEQEVETLKLKIVYYEEVLEGEELELKQTRRDLERSLEYLRELAEKNDGMSEHVTEIESQLKMEIEKNNKWQTQLKLMQAEEERELERKLGNLNIELLRSTSVNEKDRKTIEQMEDVIDDLEKEIKMKDSNAENYEMDQSQKCLELGNIVKDFEEEIKIKNTEIERVELNCKRKCDDMRSENEALVLKVFDLNSTNTKLRGLHEDSEKNIKQLEEIMQECTRKFSDQTKDLNRLNTELKSCQKQLTVTKQDSSDEGELASKETDILKLDLENKNVIIKTLQHDFNEKQDQYEKVLSSLNKRRAESKTFLRMQHEMQNEVDRKEDVITKLKFKLKSNELDITDTSTDFTDGSADNTAEDIEVDFANTDGDVFNSDKDTVIEDMKRGLELTTNQLSDMRSRNNILKHELESCREEYLILEQEKRRSDDEVKVLTNDLKEVKNKLDELRSLMENSPNETYSDENKTVGFKTKLYAVYKELREKSVEIATLKITLDVKVSELEALSKQLKNKESSDFKIPSSSPATKCNHSNGIKSLVRELQDRDENERQLQDQITDLRCKLMSRSEHCDYLQNELVTVVGKLKNVERTLLQEDLSLKERFVYGSEEFSDISELTPFTTNSGFSTLVDEEKINPLFVKADEGVDETLGQVSDIKIQDVDRIQELELTDLQKGEEILYYKQQISQLRTQITDLTDSKKKLEITLRKEIEDLRNRLSTSAKSLLEKDKIINSTELQLTNQTRHNADGT